ncbi:MAG: polysaccharide biosynthesis protein, partial [Clostridiales bacterium]|nr:polysaccharide biosynthesis protein [Clostridiales bacterium]
GAEGMGLYQMVFPVYTVLLAFCGGGVASAVSRVVAKYTARGDDNAAVRAVKSAAVPLIIISIILTSVVMIFRNVISTLQGNPDASLCYLALAPSLLFSGGTGVLRGYFQGKNNMMPSGISQLIEQVVKLFLGLFFARVLSRYGVKYAVAGALLGVTASELLALLYLFLRYVLSKKCRSAKLPVRTIAPVRALFEAAQDGMIVTDKQLRREIMAFALPITLGSLVIPLTQMIDSALVINLLMRGAATRAEATALFGLFVGPVGTLINMPTVIVSSVSVAFLPALTADLERGGDGGKMTKLVIEFVMMFVIPVTVAFMLFPESICAALYRRGLTDAQLTVAARLLRVQAITVFYAGAYQVFATMLQTRGKAHRPMINLAVGGLVKIALTPLLVIVVGISGAAAATTALYGVAAALTARSACRLSPVCASVKNAFLMPLLFSAVGAAAFWGVGFVLGFTAMSDLWKTVISTLAFMTVYATGMTACGAIDVKILIKKNSERVRQKPEKI